MRGTQVRGVRLWSTSSIESVLSVHNRASHMALWWEEQHIVVGNKLVTFDIPGVVPLHRPDLRSACTASLHHICGTVQG